MLTDHAIQFLILNSSFFILHSSALLLVFQSFLLLSLSPCLLVSLSDFRASLMRTEFIFCHHGQQRHLDRTGTPGP